jgi:hypothetical protein
MLQAATAACSEIWARRRNAFWAWRDDRIELRARTAAAGENFFTREGHRDPGSFRIGAITIGANANNVQFFGRGRANISRRGFV